VLFKVDSTHVDSWTRTKLIILCHANDLIAQVIPLKIIDLSPYEPKIKFKEVDSHFCQKVP
jgi:hypothetical protein